VSTDEAAVLPDAQVRSGQASATTDQRGVARLTLTPGHHTLNVHAVGFRPITTVVTVPAGRETPVQVELRGEAIRLAEMTVSSTRTGRRMSQTPIRVEVVSPEEMAEGVAMAPAGVAHLLSETNGLRVQTTAPSLGGSVVRIQGLRGQYTQVLADGLPLYGGVTGSLSLLQIPPIDLQRIEVIKGVASALYGAQALGGVVNLVSRPPEHAQELLLNQTSREGTDLIGWLAGGLGKRWGYTLLASGDRQAHQDLDQDGWADIASFRRGVFRPRLFWDNGDGSSLLLTSGATLEDREGGTLTGRTAPNGLPFPEALGTRRYDVGAIGRWVLGEGRFLTVRASGMQQRHRRIFGGVLERDRYRTGFSELALTLQQGSAATWVVGGAYQADEYRAADVARVDYSFTVPAAFVQYDRELTEWASISVSGRLDRHSRYGAFLSPRLSLLLRPAPTWTARLSGGTGVSAPTPFTEETDAIGLSRLLPLNNLRAERARGLSADISAAVGPLDLNGTLFGSIVNHAVQLREAPGGPDSVELINAWAPTRTYGAEVFVRWRLDPFSLVANYSYLHSTEMDPATGQRRQVPLNPRHTLGLVAVIEEEDEGRIGIEGFYTGRQAIAEDPYRTNSRPYLLMGILAEKRFGRVQVFLNGENLLNIKQTNYDPLVQPTPGLGGRWTTEEWAPLEGRVVNGGVRIMLKAEEEEGKAGARSD
jgi:iron complex outermembrane receptor protein